MNYGIVGARDYPASRFVMRFIEILPKSSKVISGGARGVDSWAAFHARRNGLRVKEYFPETGASYNLAAANLMARNTLIVNDCDVLIAFTHKQSGGTWDSIRKAIKRDIPVYLCDGNGEWGRLNGEHSEVEALIGLGGAV